MNVLRERFREVLIAWIVGQITVESVRKLLGNLLERLKEKAAGTENPIDDSVVAACEYLLADDSKLGLIVAWIKNKLSSRKVEESKLCADGDEYMSLAVEISAVTTANAVVNHACEISPDMITLIATVLRTILPLMLDYLTNKEAE